MGLPGTEPPAEPRIVLVTERESPESALQYLHVLDAWPESGTLDYSRAIELPEGPVVAVHHGAVYVHQPQDSRVRRLTVGSDGLLEEDVVMSFETYGINSFDAEMIYADDRAYLVDEATGQIITWDPETMTITSSTTIDPEILERDGLPVQFQRGLVTGGRAFSAVNWRNWDTLEYHPAAAMGIFDATAAQPTVQVVQDARCAPSVGIEAFVGEDDNVYLVSDAALGFDSMANPTRADQPLCVLRMRPGASEFDPNFMVDLRQVTGSSGIVAAHPMRGNRLLVNLWATDVDAATVASDDPSWWWDAQAEPYFDYQIVDLETASSVPVPGLPRAAVQFGRTLRLGEVNYVQLYRDDNGSALNRVDPDGTVAEVLRNPAGTDIQFLSELAPR
jgi:hypothetical protein